MSLNSLFGAVYCISKCIHGFIRNMLHSFQFSKNGVAEFKCGRTSIEDDPHEGPLKQQPLMEISNRLKICFWTIDFESVRDSLGISEESRRNILLQGGDWKSVIGIRGVVSLPLPCCPKHLKMVVHHYILFPLYTGYVGESC